MPEKHEPDFPKVWKDLFQGLENDLKEHDK